MRNLANMHYETRRALEWLHLVLAAACVAISISVWFASQSPAHSSVGNIAIGFCMLLGFPLLLVTSALLLFKNRMRAAFGFAALFVSIVALSLSIVVIE